MCNFWQEGIDTFCKVHCSNLIWKQIQPGVCPVSYFRGVNLSLRADLKANAKPLLKRGMCQRRCKPLHSFGYSCPCRWGTFFQGPAHLWAWVDSCPLHLQVTHAWTTLHIQKEPLELITVLVASAGALLTDARNQPISRRCTSPTGKSPQ